jgi:Relaxase/Mobilisation nuclease domain
VFDQIVKAPRIDSEIAATQQLNARAKSDRTYHLLISLRAGENPDAKTLRAIEERFCKELGYAEHPAGERHPS